MQNTLLIGNGLDQALYENAKNWEEILSSAEDLRQSIHDYTFLYETNLLRKMKKDKNYSDNAYKGEILSRLLLSLDDGNKRIGAESIEKLYEYAKVKRVDNILSTNYDHVVEDGLLSCGFAQILNDNNEKIYSIRRKRVYKKNKQELVIWKIHGDQEKTESICLGYDQYCGAVSKIQDYVKGTYYPSTGEGCRKTIEEKIKNNNYDGRSWIELFFNSNVYIVGFSLDSSEIDIWWLLQRRARLIGKGGENTK